MEDNAKENEVLGNLDFTYFGKEFGKLAGTRTKEEVDLVLMNVGNWGISKKGELWDVLSVFASKEIITSGDSYIDFGEYSDYTELANQKHELEIKKFIIEEIFNKRGFVVSEVIEAKFFPSNNDTYASFIIQPFIEKWPNKTTHIMSKFGTLVYTFRYFFTNISTNPQPFLDNALLALEDAKKDGYEFSGEWTSFFKSDLEQPLGLALRHITQNAFQHNNFIMHNIPMYGRTFYEDGDIVIQVIGGGESKLHEEIDGKRFWVSNGIPEQSISNHTMEYKREGLDLTFEKLNALRGTLILPGQNISICWFHDENIKVPEYDDHPYNLVVTELRLPLIKQGFSEIINPLDVITESRTYN